jgi:hypothetical protein
MAQSSVINTTSPVNTSTYRLAGSCDFRTYVACDDTPYWEEKPVTVIMPNPDYNPVLVEKLSALRETREGCCKNAGTLIRLITDNPQATVAELAAMLKN